MVRFRDTTGPSDWTVGTVIDTDGAFAVVTSSAAGQRRIDVTGMQVQHRKKSRGGFVFVDTDDSLIARRTVTVCDIDEHSLRIRDVGVVREDDELLGIMCFTDKLHQSPTWCRVSSAVADGTGADGTILKERPRIYSKLLEVIKSRDDSSTLSLFPVFAECMSSNVLFEKKKGTKSRSIVIGIDPDHANPYKILDHQGLEYDARRDDVSHLGEAETLAPETDLDKTVWSEDLDAEALRAELGTDYSEEAKAVTAATAAMAQKLRPHQLLLLLTKGSIDFDPINAPAIRNLTAGSARPDGEKIHDCTFNELNQVVRTGSGVPVEVTPPGERPIKTRLVWKVKVDHDASKEQGKRVYLYKARLVILGYLESFGDTHTYASVAVTPPETVRLLLHLSLLDDMETEEMVSCRNQCTSSYRTMSRLTAASS